MRPNALLFAALLVAVPAASQAGLVINEIDYDQIGTDATEYIELKNTGPGSIALGDYAVELVNGTGGGAAIYATYPLPAVSLAAGDYFVLCAGTVANCDLTIAPATNAIQNGAPDAVGLRHVPSGTLADAVSYEGDTGAPYTEGTGFTGADDNTTADLVIVRFPDGTDTGDNNADWRLATGSPGAPNLPTVPGPGALALGVGAAALAALGGWRMIAGRKRSDG